MFGQSYSKIKQGLAFASFCLFDVFKFNLAYFSTPPIDNKNPSHQLAEGNNFVLLRNQPVKRFLAVAEYPNPKSAVDTNGFPEVDLIQKGGSGGKEDGFLEGA